jgi:hypothetical protein
MRVLKDGTIKYKASALKAAEWMAQSPLPMRSFRKNDEVYVFMGAGWDKGKVINWSRDGVSVWLARKQKTAVVRDNRNIKTPAEKK